MWVLWQFGSGWLPWFSAMLLFVAAQVAFPPHSWTFVLMCSESNQNLFLTFIIIPLPTFFLVFFFFFSFSFLGGGGGGGGAQMV